MGNEQANRNWPKKFEALRLLGCDHLNGNRCLFRTQHLLRSVSGLAYRNRLLGRVGACLSSDPHTRKKKTRTCWVRTENLMGARSWERRRSQSLRKRT